MARPYRSKKPANTLLDFVLGLLGLIGLVVQVIRKDDNEISWMHFAIGFGVAVLAFILIYAIGAACLTATVVTTY